MGMAGSHNQSVTGTGEAGENGQSPGRVAKPCVDQTVGATPG